MAALTVDAEHCRADSETITLEFLLEEGCVFLGADGDVYTADNAVLTADMTEICEDVEPEPEPPVVPATPVAFMPDVYVWSVRDPHRRKRLIRRMLLLG